MERKKKSSAEDKRYTVVFLRLVKNNDGISPSGRDDKISVAYPLESTIWNICF